MKAAGDPGADENRKKAAAGKSAGTAGNFSGQAITGFHGRELRHGRRTYLPGRQRAARRGRILYASGYKGGDMIYFVGAGSGAPDLITVRTEAFAAGRRDYLCRLFGESQASLAKENGMQGV